MSYSFKNVEIKKVGVVGAGQIGPDIALYFSKVLVDRGIPVVVRDVVQEALDKASARTRKKLDKGVETGAFTKELANSIADNLTWTKDISDLADCDLIVEAATENKEIKHSIFTELESLCSPETIFLSNSSHMEPEVIFSCLKSIGRSQVAHYFFPAERNPIVEVVPGSETNPDINEFVMRFYEDIGKFPINVKSRYGYAIDPIFEGVCQAACLCLEEGLATLKQIDAIGVKVLGLGVGPFVAMNLTGGNPILAHGLNGMHTRINPWFKTPASLQEKFEKKEDWETAGRGEEVTYDEETEKVVGERLLGTYFGLTCEVLDSGISNIADLEMAVELAMDIKAPFRLMNETGLKKSLKLVKQVKEHSPDFVIGKVLEDQAASGKDWHLPYVLRSDRDGVAVITMRRPKALNAINRAVIDQLRQHIADIKADNNIKGVVITGFGKKAFVSGADIQMLASAKSPAEAEAVSRDLQECLISLEELGKPSVCAINGLAFGGGIEIAMACTARIATEGLSPLGSQPEVKLGIIPGGGGTQRLPRLVGFDIAWDVLRTGRTFSAKEALEWGLIQETTAGQPVDRAVELARQLASSPDLIKPINKEPLAVPDNLPKVDIGELSTKVDEILRKAIIEGAKMPLKEGLSFEADLFGQVFTTQDVRIGLDNFVKNGVRKAAKFVNA